MHDEGVLGERAKGKDMRDMKKFFFCLCVLTLVFFEVWLANAYAYRVISKHSGWRAKW